MKIYFYFCGLCDKHIEKHELYATGETNQINLENNKIEYVPRYIHKKCGFLIEVRFTRIEPGRGRETRVRTLFYCGILLAS